MISQPDLRWKRCDIKSTNLLANVLATEAARRAGCHEAVLVDSAGFVTEATHSSLLWVRQGRLEGTPEGHEILPGMTRGLVLRLIEPLRNSVSSGARVTLAELMAADEVILVGTTTEVVPVIEIDGQTVGSGAPGPLARRLGECIAKRSNAGWPGRRSLCKCFLPRGQGTPAGAGMTTSEESTTPFRPISSATPCPTPASGSSCSPVAA